MHNARITNRISKKKSHAFRKIRFINKTKEDLYQAHMSVTKMKVSQYKPVTQPTLIGDGSKNHCLPLIEGRHQDLNAISPKTLMELITRNFKHVVKSYKIIDCRYPYEFSGGHIEGAINLYSRELCLNLLHSTIFGEEGNESDESVDDESKMVDICGMSDDESGNSTNESGNSAPRILKRRNILIFYCEFGTKRSPAL